LRMEPENLNPMPRNIFLLEPRIRSLYELGLLCLSVLWVELSFIILEISFSEF